MILGAIGQFFKRPCFPSLLRTRRIPDLYKISFIVNIVTFNWKLWKKLKRRFQEGFKFYSFGPRFYLRDRKPSFKIRLICFIRLESRYMIKINLTRYKKSHTSPMKTRFSIGVKTVYNEYFHSKVRKTPNQRNSWSPFFTLLENSKTFLIFFNILVWYCQHIN